MHIGRKISVIKANFALTREDTFLLINKIFVFNNIVAVKNL